MLFFLHGCEGFACSAARPLKIRSHQAWVVGRGASSSLPPPAASTAAAGLLPPPPLEREEYDAYLETSGVVRDPVAPGPHVLIKGRIVNPAGLYFAAMNFAWALFFYPALTASWLWSMAFDRKRRAAVDWVVRAWAACSMVSCGCWPRVGGLENLPEDATGEALLWVPNHTSFMDIYALSGFVPRRLKYVSKVEILRVPLIGWAMRMAKHVAIRRTDRRSQLQTFKDTVESLQAGNHVVTFAEGTRSPDGTLKKFKKGPFKMSAKAGVRILPVSIGGCHRWMPPSCLLPLGFPGRSVHIQIHPPVETAGRPEDEVLNEVFAAINRGLPEFQRSMRSDPPPNA